MCPFLDQEALLTVTHVLVTFCLDYCNVLYPKEHSTGDTSFLLLVEMVLLGSYDSEISYLIAKDAAVTLFSCESHLTSWGRNLDQKVNAEEKDKFQGTFENRRNSTENSIQKFPNIVSDLKPY